MSGLQYVDEDGAKKVVSSLTPMPTISTYHLRVHEGKAFFAGYLWTSLSDDANADLYAIVPSGVFIHATVNVSSGGESEFRVYEGSVMTSNGTLLTPFNRNRGSTKTANSTFFYDPTIDTLGDELVPSLVPGGQGPHKPGGSDGLSQEFLYSSNNYLFRITNRSGSAIRASIGIDFYDTTAA